MIDAGSSGTRAHCFYWEKTRGIPQVRPARDPSSNEIWLIKSKIPLKKAHKNTEIISQIFDPIIQYYSQRIPPKYLTKTRIFVYATAGLRLLDELQQQIVMNQTYSYLAMKSPLKIKPRYVRVISGIEEGIYGWISVNHLKGRFCHNCNTIGALDMGGASNQIAVRINSSIASSYFHIIRLGLKQIHLFAHSYLGYGQTEALKTAIDYYLKNQKSENSDTIQNSEPFPCFNEGYQKERKGVQIISKGNWAKCCTLAYDALLSDPAFTSVKVPHDTKEYIAMASFYYTNDFLKLSPNSTLKELRDAGEKHCTQDWKTIDQKYPNNPYVSAFCWNAAYQYTLLTKGYGFDKTILVEKAEEIDGIDLSWAIGAIVKEASDIEIDDRTLLSRLFPIVFLNLYFCVSILIQKYQQNKKSSKFHI